MSRVDLRGLPICITGASAGIGLATARACAAAGMPVMLAARRTGRLALAAERINAAGGRAAHVECDVADAAACERMIDATVEAFGSVYAVFANAGYGQDAAVHETTDAALREMFEVNFFGSLNAVRPALPRMLANGRGHVLLCSSCLAVLPVPFHGAYCATKASQRMIGRAMRLELEPHGVHVSTVCPIGTRTEFFDVASERSVRPRTLRRSRERLMQPPEVVADAVVRCLRRPRTEVWTSATLRLAAGVATVWPGFADALIRRMARRRVREAGAADGVQPPIGPAGS